MEEMKIRGGSYLDKESHQRTPEYKLKEGEEADGAVCDASFGWLVVESQPCLLQPSMSQPSLQSV